MTAHEGQIEWPDIDRFSDIPVFNTKAVVQQTGVPAPTLRAWERRYSILSPERANNTYRLYSERDITLIRWLKERVHNGMSISQAIALFRHLGEEQQHIQQFLVKDSVLSDFQVALPPPVPAENPVVTAERENNGASKYTLPLPSSTFSKKLQINHPTIHNMDEVQDRLLEAFKVLDEQTAHLLITSMLAIYSVEQVCLDLITPTLWRIGALWEQGKISVSVEHFASNYFRGLLINLLHVTPVFSAGPLVIICCAPGEPHELAPLMLALFLRRNNVHVAYLGQSIETAGLLHTIQQLEPALVCVSITMPAYLASLIDLGQKIEQISDSRPIFAFGGQVFTLNSHLSSHVPGIYLSGNLLATSAQLRLLLAKHAESVQ